ncbi:MAG: DUF4352 domain-containing protein [Chloroflexales bacterium]|nr:DUF4352 domain-containing protein [Chloroflexales bacterium]
MYTSRKSLVSLVVICVVMLVSLACGSSDSVSPTAPAATQQNQEQTSANTPEPTNTPQPTPIPPTPTPQPIGLSRSNPFPSSEVVTAPNWDVQVLESVRGDAAWQSIQTANQFNEPAPEGMEYLLVKLHVKCTYDDSEEHSIGGSDFKVTGDRFIQYSGAAAVEPDPQLDARLFKDGETEGWAAFFVGQGEGNLILIFDELLSFDEDRRRFIALDEGASIAIPSELSKIEPTDLGKDRDAPVPVGETVIIEDWKVNLLEVMRGEEVWTMVQEANQFNEPPDEGMEYIAVKVYVQYIETKDSPAQIDGSYFKTTGSANVLYDLPSVVDPEPALDATLFPGGEVEGWVILQAAQEETDIIAIFEPLFSSSSANKRFISLEP